MNALRQNKAACAYPAMLLNGVCASSGGVVMALLQERYGLSYQWSGLLLAMLSVGNLAAGFAAGPRTGASGAPFLCWRAVRRWVTAQ